MPVIEIGLLRWTPARHKWLNACHMGLVNVYTCRIHADTSFDVWYVTDHPMGWRAEHWMSELEVRTLWTASTAGHRMYRVAKLTGPGKRLLKSWNDRRLPPGTRRELASVAHTTR